MASLCEGFIRAIELLILGGDREALGVERFAQLLEQQTVGRLIKRWVINSQLPLQTNHIARGSRRFGRPTHCFGQEVWFIVRGVSHDRCFLSFE